MRDLASCLQPPSPPPPVLQDWPDLSDGDDGLDPASISLSLPEGLSLGDGDEDELDDLAALREEIERKAAAAADPARELFSSKVSDGIVHSE